MSNVAGGREAKKRSLVRTIVRWALRAFLAIVLVAAIVFVFVFRDALYNRFVRFPREAKAWQRLQARHVDVSVDDGWNDYQGVCHSHSHFSHDSQVTFEEIQRALKETGRDFILMSDHCIDGKADYSLQWDGVKDGILFVPGFEMSGGFMPWGLPSNTVLDCGGDPELLADTIGEAGGLLFFAHSEEDRPWNLPQLVGMEIYNIHTDFKDEDGYRALLPDIVFSIRKYPDHVIRTIFDRQTEILANWDRLNKDRHIVGIAANDCHQNNGFTGRCTDEGKLLVEDTSPDAIGEYELNWWKRLGLRVLFGPLEPGRELFRFELDPYERMVRYVSTHILAHELSREAILESLREGRVYIAFDVLADSTGFVFVADSRDGRAVMGERIPLGPDVHLRAGSPVPCRFTVVHDGVVAHQAEGRELDWQAKDAGKYRIEAEVDILGEWTPWVYTNPIEVAATAVASEANP
ncbi:MAG TPA: hypothetical protein PLJ71_20335 [Candidatus Hydrogenedentes bacterium]|nr:hypothetical protein [Candidatus Hydrogenedentota bacterium]HQM51042.1 hypothetical protein [Candidatus Hydrogenedentota bacterium]